MVSIRPAGRAKISDRLMLEPARGPMVDRSTFEAQFERSGRVNGRGELLAPWKTSNCATTSESGQYAKESLESEECFLSLARAGPKQILIG